MSFLFKHKTRTPAELVKQIKVDLENIVDLGGKMHKKLSFNGIKEVFKANKSGEISTHKAAKHIGQLRKMLVGDESATNTVSGKEESGQKTGEAAKGQLLGNGARGKGNADASTSYPKDCKAAVEQMCSQGLIQDLCLALSQLDLEVCRDITTCINTAACYACAETGEKPGVEHLQKNQQIFDILSAGFEADSTALHCGNIIRECNRSIDICRLMVLDPGNVLWRLFEYAESPMFEVQSDVFDTLQELLLRHKTISSQLLSEKYDQVIERYTTLLTSEGAPHSFLAKYLGLKLLGELLLVHLKDNMLRYINDPKNLMLMMNLLRDSSPKIQYEAFHVFKVFVANPEKTQGILDILSRNHKKLISFLEHFHNDQVNEQFKNEKAIVLQQINEIGTNL